MGKLGILLKKNWTLWKAQKGQECCTILFPFVLCIVVTVIGSIFPSQTLITDYEKEWCSQAVSPVDGTGPPVYDNELNLPIVTSGVCSDHFGDLNKNPFYANEVPRDDTSFYGKTKADLWMPMSEEGCKNVADDGNMEDEFAWGGACAGITRDDDTWKDCWTPKKPLRVVPELDDKPAGCYMSADMKTLNWNANNDSTVECSAATPCLCGTNNGYCDSKKYYIASPAERWLTGGYGTNVSVPVIAYAPNTADVRTIVETYLMEQFISNGVNPLGVRMKGYDTEEEFENIHQLTQMAAAIVFKTSAEDNSPLGLSTNMSEVHYAVRMAADMPSGTGSWLTTAMYQSGIGTKPETDRSNPYTEGSSRNGFLFLQAGVERALARHYHPKNLPPAVYARLKSFPYPTFEEYSFVSVSGGLIIFFVGVIALMIAVSNMITDIVTEKKERQREVMKMMGASNLDIWLSWIVKWLLQFLLISVLVTIVLNAGERAVIKFSSAFMFFVLYFSYCTTCMMFGCFVSTIFQEPTIASIAGTVLLYITYIPYDQMSRPSNYETGERPLDSMTRNQKLGLSMCPMSAFGMCMDIIGRYELKGIGATFENSFSGPGIGEDFGIGHAITMLWVMTALFTLLTWYCDYVIQGEFGTSKPYLFFLNCKKTGSEAQVHENENLSKAERDVGIQISNVVKTWPSPDGTKLAVDNLNLNVQKGEITVLLGHNGAGKTTAMSIMCGLYPPTSGSVLINGHNVSTDMDNARESLGLCPQFDVIWKKLTVRKHLDLYCRLKGITDEKYIEQEIQTFLADLNLKEKENELAETLSGGQKRCLSCSIALIGGSKTVILDEPTSGMDPEKRRLTWKLLSKHRAGRTILLTTHFMDEADLLGDRIAIMHHGKLAAAGSSVQLKKEYGSGYKLTIAKGPKFNTSGVVAAVNASVNGATPVENSLDGEVCFNLPESEAGKFPSLFKALESGETTLGLENFGVSCTTMEEVFLRVGDEGLPDGHETDGLDDNEFLLGRARVGEDGIGIDSEKEVGFSLWSQQFRALFYKRYIDSKRGLVGTVLSIFVPVLLVLVGFLTAKYAPEAEMESIIATCRTIAFAGTNPEQTFYISGHDTSYDKFSDMQSSIKTEFESISDIAATAAQTGLYARATQYVTDKDITIADYTDKDFSAELLKTFDDFTTSRLLDKDKVGATFGQGVTWITNTGSGCQYAAYPEYSPSTVKESAAFASNEVKLVPGVWHTFAFDKSLNPGNFDFPPTPVATLATAAGAEVWSTAVEYRVAATINASLVPAGVDVLGHMSFKAANISKFLEEAKQGIEDNADTESTFETAQFEAIAAFAEILTGPASRTPVLRLKFDNAAGPTLTLKCPTGAGISISAYNKTNVAETAFVPPSTALFAWRTPNMVHSSAESLNFAGNVIAKDHLGTDDVEFILHNCPLPKSLAQQSVQLSVSNAIIQVSITLLMGISGYAASVLLFPFAERKSHAKHVQFVSGANDMVYWASAFTWDFMLGIIVAMLCTCCAAAINLDTLKGGLIGYFFVVLVLTLWSVLPLVYIAATVLPVESKATGFALVFFFFFQVTVICFFVVLFVGLFSQNQVTLANLEKADIGLMINPIYAMVKAVYTMSNNAQQISIVNQIEAQGVELAALGIEIDYQDNYLAWDKGGIGKHLLFLGADGFVYFILLFYIEWSSRRQSKKKVSEDIDLEGDHDVMEERQRINGGGNTDVVQVTGISKTYGGGVAMNCDCKEVAKRRGTLLNELYALLSFGITRCVEKVPGNSAVKSLTFGIHAGECFGLLGVNGAGKTTTFEMLTGEKTLSTGSVTVKGMDIATHIKDIRKHIGYCPQYDGLVGTLTGREALAMFARLRGVPEPKIADLVTGAIGALALTQFADQACGTYSGGNKRKLSTAIAIIGAPDIIFLDEPTSGMDPKSRRFLWNVLLAIRRSGKIIILTSHSMEECEALCSKVTIMKAGQFQCMGSPQHLKSKYGSGYTVTARLERQANGDPADTADLKRMFEMKFPDATFDKDVYGEVSYTIAKTSALSTLFQTLESEKGTLKIEDYSVAQTSLEQVFLKFAEDSTGDDDGASIASASRSNVVSTQLDSGAVELGDKDPATRSTSKIVKQTPV